LIQALFFTTFKGWFYHERDSHCGATGFSLLSFLTATMQMDLMAPKTGSHGLAEYFQQYARRKSDTQTINRRGF